MPPGVVTWISPEVAPRGATVSNQGRRSDAAASVFTNGPRPGETEHRTITVGPAHEGCPMGVRGGRLYERSRNVFENKGNTNISLLSRIQGWDAPRPVRAGSANERPLTDPRAGNEKTNRRSPIESTSRCERGGRASSGTNRAQAASAGPHSDSFCARQPLSAGGASELRLSLITGFESDSNLSLASAFDIPADSR